MFARWIKTKQSMNIILGNMAGFLPKFYVSSVLLLLKPNYIRIIYPHFASFGAFSWPRNSVLQGFFLLEIEILLIFLDYSEVIQLQKN